MMGISKDGTRVYGTAKVENVKNFGLVTASLYNESLLKEKALKRIRQYSNIELCGKQLFNQLGVDYI